MSILGWCFGCSAIVPWCGPGTICPQGDSPVWPGIRVNDQAELERLAPELLRVEASGHWVEWVPGERILLGQIINRLGEAEGQDFIEALRGYAWTVKEPDYVDTCVISSRIRWLRIAPAEDSNHPVPDISDIRYVVSQCREAKVPVWIESLLCTSGGGWMFPRVADPAEWPPDLRGCRELPVWPTARTSRWS